MQERTKFWHDTNLSNLELLHATYVTHAFAPHIHEGYAVGIIEQGAEQFRYRRKLYVAPAGSVVIINPGEMHTGSSAAENGWTYRMLYPSIELLQRAAIELAGKPQDVPFFAEPVVEDAEVMTEILLTHRAMEEGTPTLERESRFLWAMTRLIVRHADASPQLRPLTKEHTAIQRARSYLDECYAENISLQELARAANLSPFYFLRAFKNQMNLPPHAYQIQVRISRARQLLLAGTSCVDTALAVGFADQSHFTKHFKRIVGVPPGVYSGSRQKSNI
ncbi:MAG TPA: AraC family transcriptional regulator [Ktedonobacteraceae bacterium]|nr:AraC family transcriptional regulator [Ktedonobacteraceae bacterium]